MIKSSTPFLTFNANCKEALLYYTEIFDAVVSEKVTFEDAGETGDSDYLAQIAFSTFTIGESVFYAGDVVNQTFTYQVETQHQVSFWLELDTVETLFALEKVLKETGALHVSPIEDTFWNAKYVKVKDKFGINWELNVQL